MDFGDTAGINGLSGFYDVLREYRGAHVRILLLDHHDKPCIGKIAWVGAHLVELQAAGESQWVAIAQIAALATPTQSPEQVTP